MEISDNYKQLMELKELTRKTHCLHDAQVYHLKMWPLLLTHATKTKVSVDFDYKEVIFNITHTKGKKPTKFNKSLIMLGIYTKTLLGSDYAVVVKLKGKRIFTQPGE